MLSAVETRSAYVQPDLLGLAADCRVLGVSSLLRQARRAQKEAAIRPFIEWLFSFT